MLALKFIKLFKMMSEFVYSQWITQTCGFQPLHVL